MALSKAAQERIQENAKKFLGNVKSEVAEAKRADIVRIRSAQAFDSAEHITSLAAAQKAQRILNRVRAAVADGRLNPNSLDIKKLREITVDALSPGQSHQILQTILRGAYNSGRFEYQTQDTSRPWLIYRTMRDRRVRAEHRPLEGVMLRSNDPKWREIYPPNGHGCRCRVDSLTPAQAEYLLRTSKRVRTEAPNTYGAVTQGFEGPPTAKAADLQQYLDKALRELEV